MDFVGETREGLLALKGNICVDDDNERKPSQHKKGSIFKAGCGMRAHVLSFHYYRLCLVVLSAEIRLCLRLRDGDENRKHYPTYINVGLSFTELACLMCQIS